MTEDERFKVYINSLDRENPLWLEELETDARREGIPIIRRETQSLLRVLLAMRRPEKILEIGTAIRHWLFCAFYEPVCTAGLPHYNH